MKRAIAIAILALAGCTPAGPSTHDVSGTIEIRNTASEANTIGTNGTTCQGIGGYADIKPSAQVVLRDGAGAIIGTGVLGTGSGGRTVCTLTFTVAGVPEVPFYSVEVSHRGQITKSLAEMKAAGWTLGLTLGD